MDYNLHTLRWSCSQAVTQTTENADI